MLALLPAAGWVAGIWAEGVLGGAAAGLLSLPICIVLAGFATRRPAWSAPAVERPGATAWLGVLFALNSGALLAWWAYGDDWLVLSAALAPPTIWVWCWGALGYTRAAALTFPIAFLTFAIPWEHFLRRWIDMALQEWSADIAYGLLALVGHPVRYWNDLTIYTQEYFVIVNEECSGMNMLMTLGMYTLVFGWFAQPRWRHRALLVLLVLPLAMLANGARVSVIYLMGVYGGDALAMGFWHTGSAYLIFLPVFWFLYVVNGALLDRAARQRAARREPPQVE